MKARGFRFGTGRLGRLSASPTRGAMMARMPYRHISRSIRPRQAPLSLRPQGDMNPAAITLTAVVMDLPDHSKERRNWK